MRKFREEFGHPLPALTVLRKFPARAEELRSRTPPCLARVRIELWFVIEGIDMRGRSLHAEKDDALRAFDSRLGGEGGQAEPAETEGGILEEMATIHGKKCFNVS